MTMADQKEEEEAEEKRDRGQQSPEWPGEGLKWPQLAVPAQLLVVVASDVAPSRSQLWTSLEVTWRGRQGRSQTPETDSTPLGATLAFEEAEAGAVGVAVGQRSPLAEEVGER
jgi:hypothetical protein